MKILNYNPINKNDQLKDGNNIEKFIILDSEDIQKNTYMISSFGRLFNLNTKLELLMTKRPSGYIVANIKSSNGLYKNIYPHRVILNLFKPKTKEDIKNNKNYILFIDGDKTNMRVDNMEWVSLKTIRSLANYTIETNKRCTLTIEQVHMICSYLEKGYRINKILELLPFKTTYNIISNIIHKRAWLNISSLYDIDYSKNRAS